MKLYLLRHGETDWNRMGKFQGCIDISLNEAGRDLARVTREAMPPIRFDRVYCSPLDRARETARILLDGCFPLDQICYDERIKEFSFGEWEGTIIKEASEDPQHPLFNLLHHPEAYVPQGRAESFDQLVARARGFLDNEILPLEKGYNIPDDSVLHSKCENILLVAHGAIIRAFVVAIGAKTVADFWKTRYLNCCLTTLDIKDGLITLEKEAETFYDASNFNFGWKRL